MAEHDPTWEDSFYDRVGGRATFVRLMRRFFLELREDPELAAMYSHDWHGAECRLLLFFEQYWGGPMTYSRTRGAPMLKMRHMPYKITERMKDHWLRCMHTAIDEIALEPEDDFLMRDYVERAAKYLINADE